MSLKPFWSGTLEVGLVQIPVGLVAGARDQGVAFRRLHNECLSPTTTKPWCASHDRQLEPDDIVRGYEVTDGQHVLVTDEQLDAVAPTDTRTITVTAVVPGDKLDPALIGNTYLLAPSEAPIGRKPYELVRRALAATDDVRLLVRMVVKGHEWVAQIRAHPTRPVMILEQLRPVEELVDAKPIQQQLTKIEISEREQHLANELILGRLQTSIPTRALTIEHRARVRKLIDGLLTGEPLAHQRPVTPGEAPQQLQHTDPVDLADQLAASIRGNRARSGKQQQARKTRRAPVNR